MYTYYIIAATLCITGLTAIAKRRSIKNCYQKAVFVCTLANELHKNAPKKDKPEFELSESDNWACIRYIDNSGNERQVVVPYNRSNVMYMSTISVSVMERDGSYKDITQQPGLPYLITPNMLECECIVATNNNTGMSYTYTYDTAPLYCTEVYDME